MLRSTLPLLSPWLRCTETLCLSPRHSVERYPPLPAAVPAPSSLPLHPIQRKGSGLEPPIPLLGTHREGTAWAPGDFCVLPGHPSQCIAYSWLVQLLLPCFNWFLVHFSSVKRTVLCHGGTYRALRSTELVKNRLSQVAAGRGARAPGLPVILVSPGGCCGAAGVGWRPKCRQRLLLGPRWPLAQGLSWKCLGWKGFWEGSQAKAQMHPTPGHGDRQSTPGAHLSLCLRTSLLKRLTSGPALA